MGCKIVIIGAGGACFGIGFAKNICDSKYLKGCTLVMMDINEIRLADATKTAIRYRDEIKADVNIISTTDREEALEGADYVILTALVKGNDIYQKGIEIGKRHGYKFGGSLHIMHDEAFYINFYQLRLMEDVLKDVLRICPNAYFITTSNPVQAGITYLGRKYPQAKIVGMCPGFSCFYHHIEQMGLDKEKVEYNFAGVNHFIWLTEFKYDGKDAIPLFEEYIQNDVKKRGGKCKIFDIYHNLGLFPIGDTAEAGGGAWGWYYHVDKQTENKYFDDPTLVWENYFIHCAEQLEYKHRISEDESLKVSENVIPMMPDWTIELIESIEGNLGRTLVVDVMNDKEYTKNLPRDYQTEIKAVVDADGIHPISNNGLPRQIMSLLLRDRMAPIEMELAAFETGNKRYLKELIMMDPWTKDEQQADAFLEEILNQPWNAMMKEYFDN